MLVKANSVLSSRFGGRFGILWTIRWSFRYYQADSVAVSVFSVRFGILSFLRTGILVGGPILGVKMSWIVSQD